jgi:hypothetical protein
VYPGALAILYTNPTDPTSAGYFFINLCGLTIAAPPGNLLVRMNGRYVVNDGSEADLASVLQTKPATTTTVEVRNNTASTIYAPQVTVSGTGVLATGALPSTLAPSSSASVGLKLDSSTAGMFESTVTITYQLGSPTAPVQSAQFRTGGVVWSSLGQIQTTQGVVSAPNSHYPVFGSEHLALGRALTETQFTALIPTLSRSPAEATLRDLLPGNDLGNCLYNLAIASGRVTTSPGAAALIKNAATSLVAARHAASPGTPMSTIETGVLNDLQALAKDVIDSTTIDPYGLSRRLLLSAIANVPAFGVFTRSFAGFALLRGMDVVKGLNPMGRFFMRNALVKAYLSTNPPLQTASTVLVPALAALHDAIALSVPMQQIAHQYPEIWYSLGGGL